MLQKSSILQTAEYFFAYPSKEHYLMDISRNIGLAHTSTKKNLKKLVKLGMIVEYAEKKGGRLFPIYKANLNGKMFKRYKLIYNLSSILESSLIDFIEEALAPKSIVLFGSYSRGEDGEQSDIDFVVNTSVKEMIDLTKFEKILGRKI